MDRQGLAEAIYAIVGPDSPDEPGNVRTSIKLRNSDWRLIESLLRSTGTGRSEAEANWQPISTAPSDGRKVVIARRGAKEPEVVAADGEWWRSTVCLGLDQRPRLWCELPVIPAQAAGGGDA